MALPKQGKWRLQLSKYPSNAGVGDLEIDFEKLTGSLNVTGQGSSPLTNVTITTPTRFTAEYHAGRFQGKIEGEISGDTLNLKFLGTQNPFGGQNGSNADITGVAIKLSDPRSAPTGKSMRMVIVDSGSPVQAGFLEWLKGFDGALLAAQMDTRSEWVSSVSEMAARIYLRTGTRKLTELFIYGHGAPGFQSIGAGMGGVDASGMHSIALDPDTGHLNAKTAMYLRGMRSYLLPWAVVTLGGCQVAGMTDIVVGQRSAQEILQEAKRLGIPPSRVDPGGEKVPGTRLLQEVSEALGGVWVQAGDANQKYLIPGMAGKVYRCNSNSCINMGAGWWSVPDASQWPAPDPPPSPKGFAIKGPGGMEGFHPAGAGGWIPK